MKRPHRGLFFVAGVALVCHQFVLCLSGLWLLEGHFYLGGQSMKKNLCCLLSFAASLFLGLMALSPALWAEEITAQSRIDRVVVFPQGAEVTRVFRVPLSEGRQLIVVDGLPAELDQTSLRVAATGPVGLEIGPLDHRVKPLPLEAQDQHQEKAALEAKLAGFRDARRLAQAEIDAGTLQKKLLQEMALLPSRQIGDGQGREVGQLPGLYSQIYGMMGDKFVASEQRIVEAQVKVRDFDKEIRTLKRQIAALPRGPLKVSRVVVDVTSAAAGEARFELRYQVRGAGWRPVYESRLKTGEGRQLALLRRAVIYQRTSEDWTDVRLRLSTTKPTGRNSAPILYGHRVDFKQPAPPVPMAGAAYDGVAENQALSEPRKMQRQIYSRSKSKALRLEPNVAAKPRGVKVSFGSYQMVFEVPDAVSVKRDGELKKVALDRLAFKPVVRLQTTPKRDQRAYLHAQFTNETGAPLLAGELALFRDGVYVGKGYLKAVEPGQRAEIGFGVDPKVKVKWVRLDRVKGKTGLITSSNSDVHRYKITVINGHKKALPVRIFDQMPYSEQETLTVSLLNVSPKPLMNFDDKKGVMAWDLTAKPSTPLTVDFSYQLVWPKDKQITLQ